MFSLTCEIKKKLIQSHYFAILGFKFVYTGMSYTYTVNNIILIFKHIYQTVVCIKYSFVVHAVIVTVTKSQT